MRTIEEYRAVTSCTLISSAPPAVRDVLRTEFGLENETELRCREALLKATRKVKDLGRLQCALHHDELAALYAWLREAGYRESASNIAERRMARLRLVVFETMAVAADHSWFNGRALHGSTARPITGWYDQGVLYPFQHDGFRPVILTARPYIAASGVKVCGFNMEEVEWVAADQNA